MKKFWFGLFAMVFGLAFTASISGAIKVPVDSGVPMIRADKHKIKFIRADKKKNVLFQKKGALYIHKKTGEKCFQARRFDGSFYFVSESGVEL